MDGIIRLQRDGAVATVTLNRPETRNSLRLREIGALAEVLSAIPGSGARSLILRGEGGAFCAGRDLKETDPDNDDTQAILRDVINPVFLRIRDLPIPTIAAVRGPALGLGLGLALSCDVTYVAEDAVLGSPFRNIGAILDSGGHHFLAERIGPHRAMEMIVSGRLIPGREAAALGIVNRAFGALDLDAAAAEFARSAAAGPTRAFGYSKLILRTARTLEETLELEARYQADALRTADAREGIRAFQEKRKPTFTGA
ncbi:enoyl-CoA hydratase [Azospirillum sp. RWY-5-1]|uniref:Enoyl-CoA hydratase n=1 Tax=Azospirillum oleiclasticum TaxID=2735135 RepID=A0ABX2TG01_9PROT|nr:enoyl-CoA hydratase-related protein [Azospirillum oleiclasticum]NYZ15818.1 enoyl-CoA hydratase [Azospirillum oleiclasticum]NYZ22088.1 enoyl-CoA hydratase [Azospirillum oleiclasticum]